MLRKYQWWNNEALYKSVRSHGGFNFDYTDIICDSF